MSVTNAELKEPDNAQTIQIEFDLAWENSWKNNVNHDAVWVFAKYSTDSGTSWQHATLASSGLNPSGFSTGSGTGVEILVSTDKKGGFVRRSQSGSGSVSVADIQLVWDWTADGLESADTARVRVFGIEMVYVPQGAYRLGDGDGTSESTNSFHVADNTSVQIGSSLVSGVTVDSNSGDDATLESGVGIQGSSGLDSDGNGSVDNSSFPTGYNAAYIMKYELTQGQWVDFFNTLTDAAKTNRDITNSSGKNSDAVVSRNALAWSTGSASLVNNREGDRACNYLSWMDGCAFADWAGLRPMTELEFEKSARGSAIDANWGEYAWGSTDITEADTVSGTENGTETVTTADANANYSNAAGFSGGDASNGPLRAGIFARSTTTRSEAGAGHYGSLELSGNLRELVVTIGNSQGRSFAGTHGDGTLSSALSYEGNATNTDWPGIDPTSAERGITGATGSGARGGSWNSDSARLRLSDRNDASQSASTRSAENGFRAARTVS